MIRSRCFTQSYNRNVQPKSASRPVRQPASTMKKNRECLRCGHLWFSKIEDTRSCNGCGSRYWNVPLAVKAPKIKLNQIYGFDCAHCGRWQYSKLRTPVCSKDVGGCGRRNFNPHWSKINEAVLRDSDTAQMHGPQVHRAGLRLDQGHKQESAVCNQAGSDGTGPSV